MEKNLLESAIIIIGNIAHCTSKHELEVFNGFIVVEKGKITSIGKAKCVEEICQRLGLSKYVVTELSSSQLLLPGLVDCHLHAPQFPNLGLGLDRPLLDWLDTYTFPLEKQYEDVNFAESVYKNVVWRTLKNGTTTACYFGSLHLQSSLVLAKAAADLGQRALLGKVSMNIPNDAGYFNQTDRELTDTETFIKKVLDMKNDLVQPVVTPRFALSCDEELMKKLGHLADTYQCRIQTHVSENLGEIKIAKQMYPKQQTYSEIYYTAGLLNERCVLAHGVHLEDSEVALLVGQGAAVAHCPASNTRLLSGMCPARKLMLRGVKLGLGTDVSGGDSASILDALRRCMDVSSHLALLKGDSPETTPISWKEAFCLATLGGARALSLEDKIGNFEVGKELDALVVDMRCTDSPIDLYSVPCSAGGALLPSCEEELIVRLLQQFIYLGDDRNIVKVLIKGREIPL